MDYYLIFACLVALLSVMYVWYSVKCIRSAVIDLSDEQDHVIQPNITTKVPNILSLLDMSPIYQYLNEAHNILFKEGINIFYISEHFHQYDADDVMTIDLSSEIAVNLYLVYSPRRLIPPVIIRDEESHITQSLLDRFRDWKNIKQTLKSIIDERLGIINKINDKNIKFRKIKNCIRTEKPITNVKGKVFSDDSVRYNLLCPNHNFNEFVNRWKLTNSLKLY